MANNGSINALRQHIAGMMPKGPGNMMPNMLPKPKMTRLKKLKGITTVTKVRGANTTFSTPTIGGY